MFKKLMILLIISMPIVLMSGCGGTAPDGATSLFETASVSFLATTVNSSSTASLTKSLNTDDVTTQAALTITVTPYPNFTASPFTVRNMKYTYTQASGGSVVFPIDGPNFDTSLKFAPILASARVKDQLVDLGFVPGTPWVFNVQATYTVVEDNSGKSRSYSVPLGTVRFI